MPTGRLNMRRIRDVLRLKFRQGLSARDIAVSLGLSKGSVGAYIELAYFHLGEAVRLSDLALIYVETAQAEALRIWLFDRWPEQARRMDQDQATITPKDSRYD